jgi:hypothetical protein
MNEGWIGTWSPGIGDPSIGGWVTVALYAWAAWACHRVLHRDTQQKIYLRPNERLIWRLLLITMVALGVNKQLDLQSALTELARIHAMEHGWYEQRRRYQAAFIAGVLLAGLTVLSALLVLVWKAPPATLWTCAGAAGLVSFVAIRATSLHRVDELLGWRLGDLTLNWALEMGSLAVIIGGARRRIRA